MNAIVGFWSRLNGLIHAHRLHLAMALRVTVAAVATYLFAQYVQLPLGGLWAVLTAVIVSQMSLGGSVRATIEYMIGTLGGAIYAAALALILPRSSEGSFLLALTLAIGPLAFLAALNANFRVGPFTAIIVLVGATTTQAGSLQSAVDRVLEVAVGAAVALVVSIFVLPARARALAIDAAANALDLIAAELPKLLRGFAEPIDAATLRDMQDAIGRAVGHVEASITDARRERLTRLIAEPDLGPLQRTLLRLRHDLVIIGRAATKPMPAALQAQLAPALAAAGVAAAEYLRHASEALRSRRPAPPLDEVNLAFDRYSEAVEQVRRDGMTRDLPVDTVEHLFSFGFALEQLRHNFVDLGRCTNDYGHPAAVPAPVKKVEGTP